MVVAWPRRGAAQADRGEAEADCRSKEHGRIRFQAGCRWQGRSGHEEETDGEAAGRKPRGRRARVAGHTGRPYEHAEHSAPAAADVHDIEAEFLKSLKQEIVILDTDDEKTRELKLAVKETREQLKQLIASGKTVAEVLAEHQQLAGENAKVRNNAMMELKQLVESGDIEGAKEYKRKVNVALRQMGIAELSIPVTDEERAERAAARRERMLKKRAAQAAEAEKLKKENQK